MPLELDPRICQQCVQLAPCERAVPAASPQDRASRAGAMAAEAMPSVCDRRARRLGLHFGISNCRGRHKTTPAPEARRRAAHQVHTEVNVTQGQPAERTPHGRGRKPTPWRDPLPKHPEQAQLPGSSTLQRVGPDHTEGLMVIERQTHPLTRSQRV